MQQDKFNAAQQVNVGGIGGGLAGTAVVPFSSPVAFAASTGISAAGATQGTATVLPTGDMFNVTVAAAGTGVQLPVSVAGREVVVINNGANAVLIYPATGDAINALAANAGFSAVAGSVTILYCFAAGKWFTK